MICPLQKLTRKKHAKLIIVQRRSANNTNSNFHTVFARRRILITTDEESIVQRLMLSIFTEEEDTFFGRIRRIFFDYGLRFQRPLFIMWPSPDFPNTPLARNIFSADAAVILRRFIHVYIFHEQFIHIFGFYPRFSNISEILNKPIMQVCILWERNSQHLSGLMSTSKPDSFLFNVENFLTNLTLVYSNEYVTHPILTYDSLMG